MQQLHEMVGREASPSGQEGYFGQGGLARENRFMEPGKLRGSPGMPLLPPVQECDERTGVTNHRRHLPKPSKWLGLLAKSSVPLSKQPHKSPARSSKLGALPDFGGRMVSRKDSRTIADTERPVMRARSSTLAFNSGGILTVRLVTGRK
jgi:hypothetical protein